MEFVNAKIKKCHKEYEKLMKAWDLASETLETKANFFNRGRLQKKCDKAKKEFEDFSRNVYAKAIFETYSKIKPVLVRVRTGKKYEWDEFFKSSFDKLDNLDKSALVGLVENNSGLKFA